MLKPILLCIKGLCRIKSHMAVFVLMVCKPRKYILRGLYLHPSDTSLMTRVDIDFTKMKTHSCVT